MICYFVSDQHSRFYQSDAFVKIVQYVQKGKIKGKMKESNGKLILSFTDVPNVETAHYILSDFINQIK